MNCQETSTSLLIAEPGELQGLGNSEIARHLRDCAACRARAEVILRATAELAYALKMASSSQPYSVDPEQSVPPRPMDLVQPRSAVTWRSRALHVPAEVWWALPLAAAIGSVLLVRDARPRPVLTPPDLVDVRRPVVVPVVNAPADREVAVIQAGDRMTVVWYINKRTGT